MLLRDIPSVDIGKKVLLRESLVRARALALALQSAQLGSIRHRELLEPVEVRRNVRHAERVRRLDRSAEHAPEQPIEPRARIRDPALVRDQIVLRLRDIHLPLHHIQLRRRCPR